MGLFTPYIYKNKKGKKYWLHVKEYRGKKLYYFSQEPVGAIKSLPPGFEVIENPKTGLPFLKRKTGGGFFGKLFGTKKPKTEEKVEKPEEKTEEIPKT